MVPIAHGVGQPLQDDDADPIAEYRAGRLSVEHAAMTVPRSDTPFLIQIAAVLRHLHTHCTGKGHVAFATEEGPASHMHRNQRG